MKYYLIKKVNIYYFMSLIMSMAISFQFGYFFNGAERYIPLRILFILVMITIYLNIINKEKIDLKTICILSLSILLPSIYLIFWIEFLTIELFIKSYLNFMYILLFLFFAREVFERLNFEKLSNAFFLGLLFSTIALCVETFFRLTYPMLTIKDEKFIEKMNNQLINSDLSAGIYDNFFANNLFYLYKYSSIMFYDSNYIGLFSLIILISLYFYRKEISESFLIKLLFYTNIIVLFLSFSRSAILTFFMLILFVYNVDLYNRKNYILILFLFFIFIIALLILFPIILEDGSFITKIEIMLSIFNINNDEIFKFLFGYGFIDGGYIYSYKKDAYAHALVPLLLGEIGFIGLILYIFMYIFLSINIGKYGFYMCIIFFIPSISLIDPYQLMYFWSFAYMYFILKKKKQEEIR